jgi:protein-tyrosine phosphatase
MLFDNVYNFRDIGGLATTDGATVHTGRLYRSDGLHRISDNDARALGTLGIRTVIDLRRPYEIEADGRIPPLPGMVWHNINPEHREWDFGSYDEAAGAARYLADRYLDMVEQGPIGLGRGLRTIADPDNSPVVVHCMAGKDRTGVLIGIVLALLGVDDATIAADYALSAAIQGRITARLRLDKPDRPAPELPGHVLAAPPEAMLLFLTGLRARYGSVAGCLTPAGIDAADIAALRAHLLPA